MADTTIGFHFDAPFGACEAPAGVETPARDEQLLIEGLRSGEEAAYEILISRYQHLIYNLVYRLLTDPEDASDVTQEVFLKVFRNIRDFRGQSSLKTWLYRIAVNEAHNQRRWFSRHRRGEVELEGSSDSVAGYRERLSDPGQSPFEATLNAENYVLIQEALQQINPAFRSAVVLRDIEDLSYEEIASVLQVSIGTVKSRILRGREALRKALAAKLERESAPHWTPQTVE